MQDEHFHTYSAVTTPKAAWVILCYHLLDIKLLKKSSQNVLIALPVLCLHCSAFCLEGWTPPYPWPTASGVVFLLEAFPNPQGKVRPSSHPVVTVSRLCLTALLAVCLVFMSAFPRL